MGRIGLAVVLAVGLDFALGVTPAPIAVEAQAGKVLRIGVVGTTPGGPLLAAVLPTSRSVQVGKPATAFATIINNGTSTATGCQVAPRTTLPASFAFQTTDPATNAVTGTCTRRSCSPSPRLPPSPPPKSG